MHLLQRGDRELKDQIGVTLIANAGLFIQSDRIRFLIDAIHHDQDHPFSIVSQKKLKEIIDGSAPYKDVEYILYTHCHSDHFSPKYTKEYLRNNIIKALFIPDDCKSTNMDSEFTATARNVNHVYLSGEIGKRMTYILNDDLRIHTFRTRHLGEEYKEDVHFCFVLSIGRENILITGDSDYDPATFREALKDLTIHYLVINPLFYNHKLGRQIIDEIIQPKEILINHIPFETDDIYKLRRLTKRDMEKHFVSHRKVTALTEENQTIFLI